MVPEIGDTLTTTKSGITGIVREIVENSTGSYRIRLELEDGSDRWTTLVPQ
jgi:hypothetical protein